jgi:PAS domain S-box-containing protein
MGQRGSDDCRSSLRSGCARSIPGSTLGGRDRGDSSAATPKKTTCRTIRGASWVTRQHRPLEIVLTTLEITEALDRWRAADRRWAATAPADPGYQRAAVDVVGAWLRYQEAAGELQDSVLLIVDDELRYVAVSTSVQEALGYQPSELIGLRIADIASPDLVASTPAEWQRFLEQGRQEGTFRLRARDGRDVAMRFEARAHHPIPGFHLSRLSVI